MRHVELAAPECRVQRVLRSLDGADIARVRNVRTRTEHCVRLLTWIDGEVLAKTASRGAALFESIGAGLAMRYGGAMVVAVESGDKSVGYAFS
jgi:Ser/Thr protein kinase RdoA (MazF antagonist)